MRIVKSIKKYKLSEMLSNINEQNIHKEIETGDPVGKEILPALFCQTRSKALIGKHKKCYGFNARCQSSVFCD